MPMLGRAVRGGVGVVACMAMAGCASIRTVNGVDLNSPSSDPCGRQPLTCILVGGVVVGGVALVLAGRSNRTSPGARAGSGGAPNPTLPTAGAPIVPTPTTTTTAPAPVIPTLTTGAPSF